MEKMAAIFTVPSLLDFRRLLKAWKAGKLRCATLMKITSKGITHFLKIIIRRFGKIAKSVV
jgi:hypothetical protein